VEGAGDDRLAATAGGDDVVPTEAVSAAAMVFVGDLERPVLAAEDDHHLGRSLRLRDGESVVVADGAGGWRLCRYVSGRPGGATSLETAGPVHRQPPPQSPVTIGFVPVKGDRPDWVVQKLTELGVDRIVVLRSERAVVRWAADRADRALERLRRVAREAAAQSRRPRLPAVDGVCDLDQLQAEVASAALALADPGGAAPQAGLRCLAVGPEGGWAEGERAGRPRVSLGPGVLRAETAAVAAATLVCALRDGRLRPA
jgi:16S rRNA (uracil1498-N3)-methyltransferase